MDLTTITPGVGQLKALTHPVRVRMLGLLRVDGPATATTLATRLGLNTGATSYHLRQLAEHGFIVEDEERGNGRERWWKAAHEATTTPRTPQDPDARETTEAYMQSVAVVMTEMLQRAVEEMPLVPEDWSNASTLSDWVIRLTPAGAKALMDQLVELLMSAEEEAEGTPDAEAFVVQLATFPFPGRVGGAS